jgi:hypothetical protein
LLDARASRQIVLVLDATDAPFARPAGRSFLSRLLRWRTPRRRPRGQSEIVVTSLRRQETPARAVRRRLLRAREPHQGMSGRSVSDRPRATMRANCGSGSPLRLRSPVRYRRMGLAHTEFTDATCGSIRLKPMKLAGLVRVSARRTNSRSPRLAHMPTNGGWPPPDWR